MENKEVIERISKLLQEQNKKQKDLTDYLGITPNAFTDWKSGRIKSWQKHLPKIADFLGVQTDYLLGKTENKMPGVTEDDELNEYLEELKNRSEMRMLFSLAKGASKEDVEKAVAIIEALSNTNNG